MSGNPLLVDSLRDPRCYPHVVSGLEIVETHASWVILTGAHAYKIKKPLNLGFLDYSTLEKRKHACEEELRLNRMLAPEIYLGVEPVTGTADAPIMGGAGEPLEYAVHMRQFDPAGQLDRMLQAGSLGAAQMDEAADHIARFHQQMPAADAMQRYGSAESIHAVIRDNLAQLRSLLADTHAPEMGALQRWSEAEFEARRADMDARHAAGRVRECHGDLHLANLVLYEDHILAFDRIEFNAAFRWLDVIDDCSFLVMDLMFQRRVDLAFRFLNRYLEVTGDYAGLGLLRYYLVHRSLVRTKVALVRAGQGGAAREKALEDADRHISLAVALIHPPAPCILLMHGFSGSGKSWFSERLMCALAAIRLRSDIERKRLHELDPLQASGASAGAGLYSAEASRRTYARLAELAQAVCSAGYPVIVDAAFLQGPRRRDLEALARRIAVPWVILDCSAPAPVLEERIRERRDDPSEATLEVLAAQRRDADPLDHEELGRRISIETHRTVDFAGVLAAVTRLTSTAVAGPGTHRDRF